MGRLMADNGFPRRPHLPGQALLLPGSSPLPLRRWTGTEQVTVLPLLTPEERTGRQYEHLHFEEEAERAELILLRTPEEYRPAPLPRLRARLEAALDLIPREKLLWEPESQGRDAATSALLTMEQAEGLAAAHRCTLRFFPPQQLVRFRYTDPQGREHPVSFPDLRSLRAQLDLAGALGLERGYLSPGFQKFLPSNLNSGLDFDTGL